jgi:hypothetical protein
MTEVDDNTIIIQYIHEGSRHTQTINYLNDIHELKGYYTKNNTPLIVTSLTLGKNMSCYGMILSKINNQNVMNYQHFSSGFYDFKTPIAFLTFHLNKII